MSVLVQNYFKQTNLVSFEKGCCSNEFISLHKMLPDEQIRLNSVIERLEMIFAQQKLNRKPSYKEIYRYFKSIQKYEDLMD